MVEAVAGMTRQPVSILPHLVAACHANESHILHSLMVLHQVLPVTEILHASAEKILKIVRNHQLHINERLLQ